MLVKTLKILGIFVVYRLVELTGEALQHGISYKEILILTRSHWWFVNVYLCLFLVSPLLNLWLEKASKKQRCYMIAAFFFAASYMALGGVKCMSDGKNLVNFIFLYLVGNQLHLYKDKWINISTRNLALLYILFNLLIFLVSYFLYGTNGQTIVNMISFKYSSPLLLFNAILFFLLVGKLKFHSDWINYIATSSLAIYLIHGARPYMPLLNQYVTENLQLTTNSDVLLFAEYGVYAIFLISGCVLLDKLLTPLWNMINKLGNNFNRNFVGKNNRYVDI